MLDQNQKLVRNADILTTELDGEVVMMNAESGMYFSLQNEVAQAIWANLEEGGTLEGLINAIEAEFEVDRAACTEDVTGFVQELLSAGIITAQN